MYICVLTVLNSIDWLWLVRTAVNLGYPVAFWSLCTIFPWCAYVEWTKLWMRIFLRRSVCVWLCLWWRELDGYGVVMGLFEGLYREERITEYDERIWSRELFDSFLMPLCVFVCVDVYKAFEHLHTVFIIQIISLLPCTLEPVVHWRAAEEDTCAPWCCIITVGCDWK